MHFFNFQHFLNSKIFNFQHFLTLKLLTESGGDRPGVREEACRSGGPDGPRLPPDGRPVQLSPRQGQHGPLSRSPQETHLISRFHFFD